MLSTERERERKKMVLKGNWEFWEKMIETIFQDPRKAPRRRIYLLARKCPNLVLVDGACIHPRNSAMMTDDEISGIHKLGMDMDVGDATSMDVAKVGLEKQADLESEII